MNKATFATAVALAALALTQQAARAQTGVTIYGVVDGGVAYESGNKAGSITKVTGGNESGSRLGFKGTEDLGGGNTALFLLESGIQADTGLSGQGGILFGRQAYVGLSNRDFGTVTLGRQYAPHYLAAVFVDPFVSGTSGDEKNLINAVSDGGRLNNSIKYASPIWGGASAELVYAAGEVAGSATAGRSMGLGLAYNNGPLALRFAFHDKSNETVASTLPSARNTLIGGTYDFKVAKLYLAYNVNKGPLSSTLRNSTNPYGYAVAPTSTSVTWDSTDTLVGVSIPRGPHTLLASWIHKDDKTAARSDADQFAAGYRYNFSRTTDVYLVYARMLNKNGASYTLGNAADGGTGDRAIDIGIRHLF
ncbi:porin [Massilia sp. 9096]|uniref:porin n=1 Tax=Massilia sp. 9096 TaxID=1500894 RepID=UPI00055ECAAA|nr:porin [Massilia sp. 9096]